MNTQFREAFLKAAITKPFLATPLGKSLTKHVKRNTGVRHQGRGWTANLSPRTLKKLTEEGVFG